MKQTGRPPKPILERFAHSIQVNHATGCWDWIGSTDRFGYGVIVERYGAYNKRQLKAHRLAYELFVGDIPYTAPAFTHAETIVDHICRNPSCVNPSHLRLMSRGDNSSTSAFNLKKKAATHCKHGHAYDTENTNVRIFPNGRTGRSCKTCVRIADRRNRLSRKSHG